MKQHDHGIWQYVKSYRFNSIFIKNFRMLLLLLVIPLAIITATAYYSYRNISWKEISYANEANLSKVMDIMDMIMRDTNKQSIWIASDENVQFFVKSGGISDGTFFTLSDIYDTINLFTLTYDYLDSIHVYSEINRNVISLRGSGDVRRFYDTAWMPDYEKYRNEKITWAESRNIESVFRTGARPCLSFFRMMKDNDQCEGAVIINIDMEKLAGNTGLGDLRSIVITDETGRLIYSRNGVVPEGTVTVQNGTGFVSRLTDRNQIVSSVKSAYNGWTYTAVQPVSQYAGNSRILRNTMVALVGMSVVIVLVSSFIMAVRLFRPVKTILSVLDEATGEPWLNEVQPAGSQDEIRHITTAILKAIDHNQAIEKELDQRLILLKKAQAVALQSQINPHFLYNTLESINWMALSLTTGKNNRVSDMVLSLSGMLRLSLETPERLISLAREIEHAMCYLEIQRMRYDDHFDVRWEISEEAQKYMVIKITLQPIIENAIYHGLKPLERRGLIVIRGRVGDGMLLLEVEDNGMGMSQDTLEELNADMRDDYIRENEHIGFYNVNQRIKIIYGDAYGLSVESTRGQGTRVKIRMPLVEITDTPE